MDIYSYLKKDHQKVKKLFDKLLDTKNNQQREEIFEKIKRELLVHSKTEDATFYQALRNPKPTAHDIDHAKDEHREITSYLNKIEKLKIGSAEWIEQIGEFRHSVLHHVKEEEGEIFDKAKKVLSNKRANELAQEMDDLKRAKFATPKTRKKTGEIGGKFEQARDYLGQKYDKAKDYLEDKIDHLVHRGK